MYKIKDYSSIDEMVITRVSEGRVLKSKANDIKTNRKKIDQCQSEGKSSHDSLG